MHMSVFMYRGTYEYLCLYSIETLSMCCIGILCCYKYNILWFEMTLNYCMIAERYPFSKGVVGGSIFAMKSSLYLTR